MIEKPIYKCVVFAGLNQIGNAPLHPFAWNSMLMNADKVVSVNHPEDIVYHLIECQDTQLQDRMDIPDFSGVSVWRGHAIGVCVLSSDSIERSIYRANFQGSWSDLTPKDWAYLQARDLDNLVDLRRFGVTF